MSDSENIVIIGGGHAAAQLCNGLVGAGLGARVHLVCQEPDLPYQRPPLSKSFLKNAEEPLQLHRSAAWYEDAGIKVHLGDPAVSIQRAEKQVTLRSGLTLPYAKLVLATGARARTLPHLSALKLRNVALLRDASDASSLRKRLAQATSVYVIGGGFIGLEVAAVANALGKKVRLLESAPRLLMRSCSPDLALHILDSHRASGIDIRLGIAIGGFEFLENALAAFTVEGVRETVDFAILGIGSAPEDQLARDAGIDCSNGVRVDATMRSSDPDILAVGDCCNFPDFRSGDYHRLESVQNANDQARTAVATLLGQSVPYRSIPWFWSDQGSMRLQMAGLLPKESEQFKRPGPNASGFSLLHYARGKLCCVESVNSPADHIAARKLLEQGISPDPLLARDSSVPLKQFL